MNHEISIVIAGEDTLCIKVARKLLERFGRFKIENEQNYHGKENLKKKIKSYHNMAYKNLPSLVITDLDTDECAPKLINDWLGYRPHEKFLFRIAVKEIEAWLLADREAISKFLGVKKNKIPFYPENLDDPKQTLINLARYGKKQIKDELVPHENSTATIGPGYNNKLSEYIHVLWNLNRAAKNSDSLARTIESIKSLTGYQV